MLCVCGRRPRGVCGDSAIAPTGRDGGGRGWSAGWGLTPPSPKLEISIEDVDTEAEEST